MEGIHVYTWHVVEWSRFLEMSGFNRVDVNTPTDHGGQHRYLRCRRRVNCGSVGCGDVTALGSRFLGTAEWSEETK